MLRKTVTAEGLEPRLLFTTYNAATDFSLTTNPSGPWTYGVRFTETADFAPFGIPAATQLDFGPGAVGWSENSGSPPYVGINTTGQEYDNDGITLPTGVLVMHPGGNGEYADLRFTAPATATFAVSYTAVGIDVNGTTTDEHVLHNGEEIGSGSIDGYQEQATGSYKISVTQGDTLDFLVGTGSNQTYYNDATSMSVQVTPTGSTENHLVFSQQPKDGYERSQEPAQVKIEDSKNHVVTTATDGVSLYLQDGTGQYKLGYVPFVRGVASFTGANAPVVFAGTQTFVAEETNAAGQFSGSAGQVTSTSFAISEVHIAFTKQPAFAGANHPFSVTVELEDDKNRPVKPPEANPEVNLFLYNVDTGASQNLARPPFVNGKPISVTIIDPGSYEITASQTDPVTGQAVDPTTNATTAPFTVLGNHLRFMKQPGNIGAGDAATFIVGLFDYKNTLIPPAGLTGSFLALLNSAEGETEQVPITLVNGKYNNASSGAGTPLIAPSAGSFTITVAEVIPGTDVDAGEGITPITSLSFKVAAGHLVFKKQPKNSSANSPIPFEIVLEDFRNRIISPDSISDSIDIHINAIVGTGQFNNSIDPFAPYASIDSGVYYNNKAGYQYPFELTSPGTYSFTVDLIDEEDHVFTDINSAVSKMFKIK